ncbi:hypothetical protein [Sedimentisphaera salicampi]|uniref:Uncharacterized protein n=1 Tax=Sedimentisphaera salicampi TaxID=1941349 RepID=A0A1W6LLW2_9BACT|nr:hypothetical protein [Sedimentisphaera salicampi]ARN56755.1 hypothetical protein STSP1_01146 [Sedimentisphaera salicampi]OXU15198.1 hypothetical protein SMSP1_01130 [Sedimentisphaera salicampi]
MIASFTAPIDIGCNPQQFLWAIPLLIIVCFIVRLEKNPVFDGPKIFRETVRLSLCAAGVMVLLALIIFGIVEFFC